MFGPYPHHDTQRATWGEGAIPGINGFHYREVYEYPFAHLGLTQVTNDQVFVMTPSGQVLAGRRTSMGLQLTCGCLMRGPMDVGLCTKTRMIRCEEKHLRDCMLCNEKHATNVLTPYVDLLPDGMVRRGLACRWCVYDRHRSWLGKAWDRYLERRRERREGQHV